MLKTQFACHAYYSVLFRQPKFRCVLWHLQAQVICMLQQVVTHGRSNHICHTLVATNALVPTGSDATTVLAADEGICHHEGWQVCRLVLSPKIAPFMGRSWPSSIIWFFRPPEPTALWYNSSELMHKRCHEIVIYMCPSCCKVRTSVVALLWWCR